MRQKEAPHCFSSGMRPLSHVREAVILGRMRTGVGEGGTYGGNCWPWPDAGEGGRYPRFSPTQLGREVAHWGRGLAQLAEAPWSLVRRRQAGQWVGKCHINRRQQGRSLTSKSAGDSSAAHHRHSSRTQELRRKVCIQGGSQRIQAEPFFKAKGPSPCGPLLALRLGASDLRPVRKLASCILMQTER